MESLSRKSAYEKEVSLLDLDKKNHFLDPFEENAINYRLTAGTHHFIVLVILLGQLLDLNLHLQYNSYVLNIQEH
ncbi:hypothetical protein L1987_16643 [Smallanthus sonchifolius]|uniref:Uncharacterized protein n=1 Tax=Smallanthus sonchifolius TaxID=185202 RepID=A0ACB9IWQ3_9ASTR|nr:hypothetical protein L1987_16643 [Smallanthus sonchifolius]